MKLQILVTQFTETEDIIRPLLDSIAIQQGVDFNDFEVIICNDGSNTFLTETFLKGFPYKITYHKEPHRGVSGTRNACLDYATADYVMFCDADDMFVSACGLYQIFLDIEGGFDTFVSSFIEEARRGGKPIYITHPDDSTFIHGKVHRRKYLVDNDIRWNENLTIHEDSYFNILCQSLTNRCKECKTPFYLWRWREGSVCRHDPKYMLKTFNHFIDSNDALVDEFIKRGNVQRAMFYFVNMVFETYYTMNKPDWLDETNAEYRDKTEKRFAEHFRKHKDLWDNTPMADKANISEQVRPRLIKQGMRIEPVTIFQWLENIGEKQCPQEK